MSEPRPYTAKEARDMGWTVDDCGYPWRAYLGPCWAPKRWVLIDTPGHRERRPITPVRPSGQRPAPRSALGDVRSAPGP